MLKFATAGLVLGSIIFLLVNDYINSFNMYGWTKVVPYLNSKEWSIYVDKIKFKKKCKEIGLKTFETIHIFENVDEIHKIFEFLPKQFIIKYNTGVGMNLFVHDKTKWTSEDIYSKIKNFKQPWYKNPWELQYIHVKPCFMVEKLFTPTPIDYKIFLFKKVPVLMLVVDDRFQKKRKHNVYKIKKEELVLLQDCRWNIENSYETIFIPPQKDVNKMVEYAKILTEKISLDLVRVDFYYLQGIIYGGEITFSSGAFLNSIEQDCSKYVIGKKSKISALKVYNY
tara:strand:- start:1950 stop:2795 length:846 start_codon:yes stop_codon:yes gene_type:complete